MCVKYLLMQNIIYRVQYYLNACHDFKRSKQLADFY